MLTLGEEIPRVAVKLRKVEIRRLLETGAWGKPMSRKGNNPALH